MDHAEVAIDRAEDAVVIRAVVVGIGDQLQPDRTRALVAQDEGGARIRLVVNRSRAAEEEIAIPLIGHGDLRGIEELVAHQTVIREGGHRLILRSLAIDIVDHDPEVRNREGVGEIATAVEKLQIVGEAAGTEVPAAAGSSLIGKEKPEVAPGFDRRPAVVGQGAIVSVTWRGDIRHREPHIDMLPRLRSDIQEVE